MLNCFYHSVHSDNPVQCYVCDSRNGDADEQVDCRRNWRTDTDFNRSIYLENCPSGICKKWDYNIRNRTRTTAGDRERPRDRDTNTRRRGDRFCKYTCTGNRDRMTGEIQ